MVAVSLSKANQKILIIGLVILLVLVMLGGAAYLYQSKGKVAGAVEDTEVTQLILTVGKLMELPEGEKPTLATVSDPAQLLAQPFFARAKVGDKVLVYLQAKKAVLYRPSTNKIINVGPVNVNQPAPTAEPTQILQELPTQRPTLTPRVTPTNIPSPTVETTPAETPAP